MAEKFYFDNFQIPQTGVREEDLDGARDGVDVSLRRTFDMKMSNFGALNVGARLSGDYTRTNTMVFKAKGESEDWNVLTEDTGIGSNVAARGMNVNHNPHIWGDSIKFVRDDQFIRMTMSNNNEGAQIDPPKFDVMDSKERSADGIDDLGQPFKNWPTEGWRSFGGKYDFPYAGGILK
jgi:hypothetical protein